MTPVPGKKSAIKISFGEKWLLVLIAWLLLFTFRELILSDSYETILPTVVDAYFNVSGVSPLLVYILAAGLLLIRSKDIAAAYPCAGASLPAVLFLVPGVCLFLWGHFVAATDLIHVAFILVLFGAARLLSGRRMTQIVLPLLLMLLVATPLPAVVINQIIFPLQLHGAQYSAWLVNAVGIPAMASGDMISMADSETRFAESCTSMGFMLWLTIYALAYVYLFKLRGWHAFLLVLSAPFIAYAVNILRAFSLVMNPALEVLTIHTLQGIVFFILGFSMLYVVDVVLIRFTSNNDKMIVDPCCSGSGSKQSRLGIITVILLLLSMASLFLPVWQPPAADRYPKVTQSEQYGDWMQAGSPSVKYIFLGSVRYASTSYHNYRNKKAVVSLFVASDDRLRRNRSLLSDKNAYPFIIGLEPSYSSVDLETPDRTVMSVVTDRDTQRWLTYYWYDGIYTIGQEILYAVLALDQSPWRRDEPAYVTRVTTYVELLPDGLAAAHQRLQSFLGDYIEYREY